MMEREKTATANGGHRVPVEVRQRTASTLRATIGLTGVPTDAERSRTLLATATFGSLATMSIEQAGFPFGSLVGYAADAAGNPLLCMSDIAEHSRNIAADARGSLMVTSGGGVDSDPLALGRVTLLGEITALEGDERTAALDLFLTTHPGAFYAKFDDFRLYRLQVASIRYVGGFGRMSWVGQEEYAAAEPDPLVTHSARIIKHMNDDHGEALVDYAKAFGNAPDTVSATLASVDRYGIDVLAVSAGEGKRRAVRVGFPAPADTPDNVRKAVVALVHEARTRLG